MKMLLIMLMSMSVLVAATKPIDLPLFGLKGSLIYYHAPKASVRELQAVDSRNVIFEIDLAWAHSSFKPQIKENTPYIGHPEEFYTKMGRPFPEDNVSLDEFKAFVKIHPNMRVLLDLKDEAVFPYVETFAKEIGKERCIVHAFIKNWTHIPPNITPEPHWYREDIDLFALDTLLSRLGVPLIANCRGFSDEHVKNHDLITTILEDTKKCKSVIALGLYFPGAPLPLTEYLVRFNTAGYYAWVNGNVQEFAEKIGSVKYIAMQDDSNFCTALP